MSLLPEVGIPRLSVQVSYPGAAARTVEDAVVAPLRTTLLQVNNLADIRSRSREEAAVLYLDFPFGTNPDLAFIEVNEKIDQAMNQLPRDVERPRVLATDVSDIPVVQLSVTVPGRAPPTSAGVGEGLTTTTDADLLELSDLARNLLRRRIEQLPEVAFADLSGQREPRLVVRPDRAALRALGLTENDLAGLLSEANVELGGLLLADGHYQYNVRFTGELRTATDLENLYLRVGARTLALSEVATVDYEASPARGAYFYGDEPGVVFTVRKRADARLFALRDGLNALVAELRADYPRLRFRLENDQTAVLRASIDNLTGGLLYGAGFAVLVLFAFFREWRRPLLIALAVPVALLVAILGFYLAGLSVNVISLAGLILGLGLMIDNSIIVLDNLSSYSARGADAGAMQPSTRSNGGLDPNHSQTPTTPPKEITLPNHPNTIPQNHPATEPTAHQTTEPKYYQTAAATNEVIRPLIASALTTVAVFVPLVLLSGIAGALFRDQAIAVSIALATSLLTAYFLLPLLHVLLLKPSSPSVTQGPQPGASRRPRIFQVKTGHRPVSPPVTQGPRPWVTNLILLSLPLALLLGYLLLTALPTASFPALSRTNYQLRIAWNEPLPLTNHCTRVRALSADLQAATNARTAAFVGERQFLLDAEQQAPDATEIQLYFDAPPPAKFAAEILGQWRNRHPSATFTLAPIPNLFDRIFLNDEPWVELRLRDASGRATPNWPSVEPLLADLRPLDPTPPARAEAVALRLDYSRLADTRVDAATLRRRLLSLFGENEVTTLRTNDRALPVLIGNAATLSTDRLLAATVTNREGNDIPLRELVRTERRTAYRVLTADRAGEYLSLQFPDGTAPATVRSLAADHPNFGATLGGRFLTDRSRLGELGGVLLVSFCLLYLILAAQFEGLLLPCIVLLVVPVSLVGSLAALWITGGTVNLLSLIGMVVTGGIVVNDAIIKLDLIQRGRAAGLSRDRAIREAGRRRLRAIVMTSLTTILALAPVLFAGGLGAELQRPLAITVIGGLLVGTLSSLYLVPALYRLLLR